MSRLEKFELDKKRPDLMTNNNGKNFVWKKNQNLKAFLFTLKKNGKPGTGICVSGASFPIQTLVVL